MVTLVRLSGRHCAELLALGGQDPEAPWSALPGRSPREAVLAFVARAQRLRARRLHDTLAAHDGNRLVGLVVLAREIAAPHQAELGYWIARTERGHGYATAAARLALGRGFADRRLTLAIARSPDHDGASARVLTKLGFRPVSPAASGVRRWELTRDEWVIAAGSRRPP